MRPMLDYKEYGGNPPQWPDLPYRNFAAFAKGLCEENAEKPYILYREGKRKDFDIWTYGRYYDECKRIARGLLAAGLRKGDRVVLWAENRPEWMAVWMGAAIAGCVIVPVDFLLSDHEALNILTITKAKAFFFSARKTEFAAALPEHASDLAVKVCLGAVGSGQWTVDSVRSGRITSTNADSAASTDIADKKLLTAHCSLPTETAIADTNLPPTPYPLPAYSEFGLHSAETPLPEPEDIDGDAPVSIVFTSGTTGFAKGVTLSHKGLIANVSAAINMLNPSKQDVFIDVLPLHHTYPTTCSFLAPFSRGIPVILVERLVGEVVIRDIRDGGGTFLISVPLLYDKVMAAINAKYQKTPAPVKFVLDLLRKKALAEANKGNPDYGRKIFRFIRKKAGLDSINIMVGGGGALNPVTADFFDSFGFNIVHGYGMSENGPLISVNTARHKRNKSVGLPVKYTDVRIADANDDTKRLPPFEHGEIIVKSPSLMLGYYENPEATAEMFTKDGFLKTGDLGYLDNEGFIYINGRKKNLIVSTGGKNIYPEEIEAHFGDSRVVGEILVLGRKDPARGGEFIFAAVYPNKEALAADYGAKAEDAGFVHKLVKTEIERVNRKLAAYKKISDFLLRDTEFEKNAQKKIRRFLYKEYETMDGK